MLDLSQNFHIVSGYMERGSNSQDPRNDSQEPGNDFLALGNNLEVICGIQETTPWNQEMMIPWNWEIIPGK